MFLSNVLSLRAAFTFFFWYNVGERRAAHSSFLSSCGWAPHDNDSIWITVFATGASYNFYFSMFSEGFVVSFFSIVCSLVLISC